MNTMISRLAGVPLKVERVAWRRVVEGRINEHHDAILRLIALLDEMDGDADLEPSLTPGRNPDGSPVDDDREGGDVLDEGEPNDWDGEDNGDHEPSLGRSNPDSFSIPRGWTYDLGGGLGGDHED